MVVGLYLCICSIWLVYERLWLGVFLVFLGVVYGKDVILF